ncbi:hypothetical protein C4D60_Mb04t31920 [Musa balbisiana]|uniref:Uncharacterized protein n=1 Tax=Musa balbisiana TaxID=52838 RepID=A0A4S8KGA8_MUSBA|nr:hypothetical protein C4D60_Mb04t31920 [Musa balbisiana]
MGVHLLIIGKLKLLAGGHSSCQILASLLCPFALKLPFVAARLPNSCADLAVSLRLFAFRLGRVFVVDATATAMHRRHGRWERALRLLHDRATGDRQRLRLLAPSDEMLTAISMLTL